MSWLLWLLGGIALGTFLGICIAGLLAAASANFDDIDES